MTFNSAFSNNNNNSASTSNNNNRMNRSNNGGKALRSLSRASFNTASAALRPDWKDISRALQKMDALYDACFLPWIKEESNIGIAAEHIKRIMSEYDEDRVAHGLRWLISDWTLGSITKFVRIAFTDDFWKVAEPTQVQAYLHQQKQQKSQKRKSEFESEAASVDEECPFFVLDSLYYANSRSSLERKVRLLARLTDGWDIKYVAELIANIFPDWPYKSQRRFFLLQFVAEWSFQRVSDLFIFVGSHVEWQLKVELLKMFSNKENKGNNNISGSIPASPDMMGVTATLPQLQVNSFARRVSRSNSTILSTSNNNNNNSSTASSNASSPYSINNNNLSSINVNGLSRRRSSLAICTSPASNTTCNTASSSFDHLLQNLDNNSPATSSSCEAAAAAASRRPSFALSNASASSNNNQMDHIPRQLNMVDGGKNSANNAASNLSSPASSSNGRTSFHRRQSRMEN